MAQPGNQGGESLVQLTTAIANPNVRERRPLHAVVRTLRALKVQIFPKQRLEDLLVFFVVLKRVDIHSVVESHSTGQVAALPQVKSY